MIDYAKVLMRKYADSQWTLDGDTYEGLVWLSDDAKPTKKVLDDLWPKVQQEIADEQNAIAAKKDSALQKLATLGLTLDDLKALGLG